MGIWTHWSLNVELRRDTPQHVLDEIRAVVADPDANVESPMWFLSEAGTTYQVCRPPALTDWYGDFALTVLASGKFGAGVESVVDYLAPYVRTHGTGFSGWKQSEEDDYPTLLYIQDGVVTWRNVEGTKRNWRQ